jgi:hypothetical protein
MPPHHYTDLPTSIDDGTVARLERKIALIADCDQQIMDSDESVEVAMRLMDIKHKTSFYNWVRNEEHLEITSLNLKRIVREYDSQTVSRGLRWLFDGWSMNGIASLLIKVYYERGLDNSAFTDVISELNVGRTMDQQTDLIATLVIGEDALVTARFVWLVAGKRLGDDQMCELVELLATKSQWTTQFIESFLVRLANIVQGSSASSVADSRVQQAFEEFHAAQPSNETQGKQQINLHLHREYSRRVLRELVLARKSAVTTSILINGDEPEASVVPALRRLAVESCSQMSSPLSIASTIDNNNNSALSSTLSSPKSPTNMRHPNTTLWEE